MSLWVGAGAAIAFLVAPVVFQRADSRTRARELLGGMLRRFEGAAAVAGVAALLATAVERLGSVGAPRALGLKLALLASMLGLLAFARYALAPPPGGRSTPATSATMPSSFPAYGLCLLGQLVLGAFSLALGVMMSA